MPLDNCGSIQNQRTTLDTVQLETTVGWTKMVISASQNIRSFAFASLLRKSMHCHYFHTVCTLWTRETFSLPACDAIATAILLIRPIQLATLAVFFRRQLWLARVLIPCLDFADDTHSSSQCVCRPSCCRNVSMVLCFGLVRPVHDKQPKRICSPRYPNSSEPALPQGLLGPF